jgi:hypothetical protein
MVDRSECGGLLAVRVCWRTSEASTRSMASARTISSSGVHNAIHMCSVYPEPGTTIPIGIVPPIGWSTRENPRLGVGLDGLRREHPPRPDVTRAELLDEQTSCECTREQKGRPRIRPRVRELGEETGIHVVDLTFAAVAEFDLTRAGASGTACCLYRSHLQAVPRLVVNDEALGFR